MMAMSYQNADSQAGGQAAPDGGGAGRQAWLCALRLRRFPCSTLSFFPFYLQFRLISATVLEKSGSSCRTLLAPQAAAHHSSRCDNNASIETNSSRDTPASSEAAEPQGLCARPCQRPAMLAMLFSCFTFPRTSHAEDLQ